jgi:hypothetical protein
MGLGRQRLSASVGLSFVWPSQQLLGFMAPRALHCSFQFLRTVTQRAKNRATLVAVSLGPLPGVSAAFCGCFKIPFPSYEGL